jgi:hypothetical protein
MKKSRLHNLAEDIKAKAFDSLEDVDGNGSYDVQFYFQQGEYLLEVKAVIEVSNYEYESGDWEQPPAESYETEFLNAFVKPLYNSLGVEMTNVTNELNKLLE